MLPILRDACDTLLRVVHLPTSRGEDSMLNNNKMNWCSEKGKKTVGFIEEYRTNAVLCKTTRIIVLI